MKGGPTPGGSSPLFEIANELFTTSTPVKRVFKTFKHKQLLRERGGRAVRQRWGGAFM